MNTNNKPVHNRQELQLHIVRNPYEMLPVYWFRFFKTIIPKDGFRENYIGKIVWAEADQDAWHRPPMPDFYIDESVVAQIRESVLGHGQANQTQVDVMQAEINYLRAQLNKMTDMALSVAGATSKRPMSDEEIQRSFLSR